MARRPSPDLPSPKQRAAIAQRARLSRLSVARAYRLEASAPTQLLVELIARELGFDPPAGKQQRGAA